MKVLESRHLSDEILLMSWSPRMDLIALVNAKGDVLLHRLSWQRVWIVSNLTSLTPSGEEVVMDPENLAWHPEGLFLGVGLDNAAFIIEVESGKITHTHELTQSLELMSWCSSSYELSLGDMLLIQSRQNPEFCRTDSQIQKVETHLSVLLLGTRDGQISVFTGGFLLVAVLELPGPYDLKFEYVEAGVMPSLTSYQFLLLEKDRGSHSNYFSLAHFQNPFMANFAGLVGPIGFRYIFFMRSWSLVQGELGAIQDAWSKVKTILTMYMTFDGRADEEMTRAAYLELQLTGSITGVEFEFFLGDSGREKEAKKHKAALAGFSVAVNDNCQSIKSALVHMMRELLEIEGFHKHVAQASDSTMEVLEDLRLTVSKLYFLILEVQRVVLNTFSSANEFLILLTNTMHATRHGQDGQPENPFEEESDPDKIIKLLYMTFHNNLAEFVIGVQKTEEQEAAESSKQSIFKEFINNFSKVEPESSFAQRILNNFCGHELTRLFRRLIPIMSSKTETLLKVPVFNSSFTVKVQRLIELGPSPPPPELTIIPATLQLIPRTGATRVCISWSQTKIIVLEINCHAQLPFIDTSVLEFSRPIHSLAFFSESFLTVLSYDEMDRRSKLESGRSIIVQVKLEDIIRNIRKPFEPEVDPKQSAGNRLSKSPGSDPKPKPGNNKTQVRPRVWKLGPGRNYRCTDPPIAEVIEIPIDLDDGVPSKLPPLIEYVLPIKNFSPCDFAINGSRNVGAILEENRRTIVLLDLEIPDKDEDNGNNTTENGASDESL